MKNLLLRLIGWKALLLHGDPCTYDRWNWLKHYLLPGPLRTLDAGCGNGAFTIYASKIGNESTGISFKREEGKHAVLRARILGIKNIQFIHNDLRKINEIADKLGKFDQIICLETIEHIQNDRKLIADLSGLLKPLGRLLLTTPYKHNKGLRGLKLSENEDGGHVRWGYTHAEIKKIFNEYQLDIQEEGYISGFISQQITNIMFLLYDIIGKNASWLVTFPLRVFQILDLRITRFIKYPYFCIGVVAVKRGNN